MQIRLPNLEPSTNDPFENDCLGRKYLEPPLTQFVTQAVGPFVLAIDGSWGSGKTTFLKMWQVKLDEAGHLCLYLNAWETDFVQDPLVAVVGELSIAIKKHSLALQDKNSVDERIEKIEKTARSIVKRLIPTVVKLATHGILDIDTASEKVLSDFTGETAQDLIKDYNKGKSDIKEFRDSLSLLATAIKETSNESAKIVIIIDELDRCRPTYAVQLLERIKHLFDVDGVVFILGIDRDQLSHSIKALYGSEFDATVYLKRFIDIDYRLPEPDLERHCYCPYLFTKFEIYELISKRQSGGNDDLDDLDDLKHYLGYLISSAQMSLRDQEQIISRLRVVLQTIPAHELIFPVSLSILLFLREYNFERYMSAIKGNLTYKEFIAFIEDLPDETQAFKAFSKNAKYTRVRFSKIRIESVFLAGLSELLKTECHELQQYKNLLDSIEKSTPDMHNQVISTSKIEKTAAEIEDIVSESEHKAGFKTTEKRLNLTSNFVQK
jgi:signal transduction histidine kinase